jgi:hypothetical protein
MAILIGSGIQIGGGISIGGDPFIPGTQLLTEDLTTYFVLEDGFTYIIMEI